MATIRLPDGNYFPVLDGESPTQAYAEAMKKYPQAFGLPPNVNDQSNTVQVQTQELVMSGTMFGALTQSTSAILWVVLFVYFAKAWKKSFNSTQLGIKWAAWFGGFGGAVYFSRAVGVILFNLKYKESFEGLLVGCVLLTITGGILGFILGWLYGKVFKFNANSKLSSRVDITQADEKLYEIVANEIDAGDIQKGLWAKAFAKCNGNESQTKALYIQTRVEQFSNFKKQEVKTPYKLPMPDEYSSKDTNTIIIYLLVILGGGIVYFIFQSSTFTQNQTPNSSNYLLENTHSATKEISLQFMTVEVIKDAQFWLDYLSQDKHLIPLTQIDVDNLEKSNTWWIRHNTLFVRINNSGTQHIKGLIFKLSNKDCDVEPATKIMIAMYDFDVQPSTEAVVNSPLPFDYASLYGSGTNCGVITGALASD